MKDGYFNFEKRIYKKWIFYIEGDFHSLLLIPTIGLIWEEGSMTISIYLPFFCFGIYKSSWMRGGSIS